MIKLIKLLCFCIFMIASSAYGNDQGFAWDANTEPDLAGYKIYRSTMSGDYSEAVQVDIPVESLEDAQNPTWTISDIPQGTFYFVITAYNIDDNESDYSNELIYGNKNFNGWNPIGFTQ